MKRLFRLLLLVLVAVPMATLGAARFSMADELAEAVEFWQAEAFWCTATSPHFPSKEILGDPLDCDDGDMTLFNGLLCLSGEESGCSAVRDSQSADGQWWRSPKRKGWQSPGHVSFSPDQSRGVLHYAIISGDQSRFSLWLSWLETNRPCLVKLGSFCVQRGWPRFCTDDPDKRCTLRPADCVRIEMVAEQLGVDGGVCRRALRELNIPEDILLPLDEFILGSAIVNDPGYSLHLVAADILLARSLNFNTTKIRQAAQVLASREPQNPLFQYLHVGSNETVRAQLLSICPSASRKSSYRFQWVWERKPKAESWKESMYWECIFLANLLQ